MNTIKSSLQAKIKTLISKIDANPHSLAESQAFHERFKPLMQKVVSFTKKLSSEETALLNEYYSEENIELRNRAMFEDELQAYRKTMMMDLVKINTDWVVTDEPVLLSPAGFHPSERIVVRHKVMICLNEKPDGKNTPRSNVPMYGHKMPAAV